MQNIISIDASPRDKTGKEISKKLRKEGYVPAVFYGPEMTEGISVKILASAIAPVANSGKWETTLINLKLPEREEETAIIREVQKNPITGKVEHLDLYRVIKGQKFKLKVPVKLLNREKCSAIKLGGVLESFVHELNVQCMPRQIPEYIGIDLLKIALDEVIHVGDIVFPDGVEPLDDAEHAVLMIAAPRIHEELAAGETAPVADVPTVAEMKRAQKEKEKEA